MTKYILALSMLALTACGSSRKAGDTSANRKDIKGKWEITDIRYEGLTNGEKLSFDLLDEGGEACLRGSTWYFPNNGNGNYQINNVAAGCRAGERKIVWSYREENNESWLQYKRLESGVKAKNIEDGYRFRITSMSDLAMTVESSIQYAGNPIKIIYTFTKL